MGGRDANGRFLPGGRGASSIADSIKDGVGNGLRGISAEIGNVDSNRIDPAIEATKEALAPVAMIAKPLGRASLAVGRIGLKGAVGTAKLLGRSFSSRGTDNWLKRLWNESRLSRRDSNLWNERRLREMRNRRGEGDGRGGMLGLIAMILPLFAGFIAMLLPLFAGFIAMLTGLFSKFFSMTGLGGLLEKALSGALARRLLGGFGGNNSGGRGGRGRNGRDPPPIDPPDADRRGRRGRRGRDRNPPTGGDNGANPPNPPPPNPPDGDNGRRRGGRMRGMRGLGWLAAGAALFGAASVEADDSLTREEKNQEHGASAGVVANGAAGALAGAAIGQILIPIPGVGAAIGALVGGYAADYFTGDAAADLGARFATWVSTTPLSAMPGQIVDKFGEWTQELKDSAVGQWFKDNISPWFKSLLDSDIGKFVTDNWKSLTDGIKSTWDTFSQTLTDTWNGLKKGTEKVLADANDWVKDKTGVDVAQTATDVAAWAGGKASSAYETVKDMASGAYEAVKGMVGGGAHDGTKAVASDASTAVPDTASEFVTGRDQKVNKRWQKAKGNIVDAAKAAGVDAGTLANIAHFESIGFNAEARPISTSKPEKNIVRQFDGTMAISTGYGYGQFLDQTWADYINKTGAKYGVKEGGTLKKNRQGQYTPESIGIANKYRKDEKLQANMLAEFTKDNIERGKELGGSDDVSNVYALHNLGEGDGAKFLTALKANPSASVNSVLSRKVIAGNGSLYGNGSMSLAEAYANMGKLMRKGDSYAQEARNMQNGTAAPVSPAGLATAATSAYDAGKAVLDKGKAWADGKLPESLKSLRVNGAKGDKTLGELGVSDYSELGSKGGQAFSGGHNDPATLYATNLISQGLGDNFGRVTAQNDAFHQRRKPGSDHTKGNKTDFTVKGNSGEADAKITETLAKYGLVRGVDFDTIDEYKNPSKGSTGGHIDFRLKEEGQAKIAKMMALEQLAGKGAAKAAVAQNAPQATDKPKGSGKPLPPKDGYDVVNVGKYYDYYEYVPKTATSAVKAPSVPAMPPPPPPPKIAAPPDPPKQSSVASQHATTLTGMLGEIGRDVPDRTIAHIVTGGIGQRN